MEYDCFQNYFFHDRDTEGDFYTSTAPSEDIWKKFELLPTPPMSPTRSALHLWPGEKPAGWRAKVPPQDEDWELFSAGSGKMLGNLSSIIIRDCMWSSFSAIKQPEKARPSAAAQTAVAPAPGRPGRGQCVPPGAPDCVDPAAVLTYPASSCRKPASSGSESRSDSSDDDEDDEDEEEIDVVTVESKQNRMRVVNVRQPVTLRVRADPCPKRFHMSVHRQQHNYAARSPDSDPEDEDDDEEEEEDDEEEEELQIKRVCSGSSSSSPASGSSRPASPSSSPQTSDAEDTDRRRNHNFLERKRRNDLKSRFLALRDQVPGLQSSKAPKVAILTHATEYLARLHNKEKRQLQERKRLLMRKQQLLRRLAELKRS
ncbi:protein L-Myc-1b-like [Neosynchiropus ocellatus]